MNSIFTKATVMACLLGPVIATAANPNQTIYPGSSSSDAFTFSLDALSNVSIDYAWSDMLLTKNGPPQDYSASLAGLGLMGLITRRRKSKSQIKPDHPEFAGGRCRLRP